jgi:hypothetical protein
MQPLPATDQRSNLGTWSVQDCFLPAVANLMLATLPKENYDSNFNGQYLQTTYLDDHSFNLRKSRVSADRYLTLRLRCYSAAQGAGGAYPSTLFALSAKTEDTKFRVEVSDAAAETILAGTVPGVLASYLPPDLLVRLIDLIGDGPIVPVVTVCAHRYAVEDATDRLTLDTEIYTDTGKHFPSNVLEFKSTDKTKDHSFVHSVPAVRPIKLSKFLWATKAQP